MAIAEKIKTRHLDFALLAIACILMLSGIFTVGTASFPLSLQEYGNTWQIFLHQLVMLGIGLAFGIVAYKIPLKTLKKISAILFLLNLILLIFVFVPKIGVRSGGAFRWISVSGFSFQPSELLKITFIVYIAAWLAKRREYRGASKKRGRQTTNKKELSGMLLPFIVILAALFFVLIFQPDLTTLGIIIVTGLAIYFFSRTPLWHTGVVVGAGGILVSLLIFLKPYRMARFITFLNPASDPLGAGYQAKQAAIALGSGRIAGIGKGLSLGLSRQKFGFLPETITDSIFAIIGEELGFIGCVALIALFVAFCWYGIKIARKFNGRFEGFMALGITVWISLQALFNIGGISGIIPLGGIPLPFFSYGGSHIIAEMIGVGILLNISKQKV